MTAAEDALTEPMVATGPNQVLTESSQWAGGRRKKKLRIYGTLAALSASFFFTLTPYNGIESLQSSLNEAQGLGTASLSVLYATDLLSSLMAPLLLRKLTAKWSLVAWFISISLFTGANCYPTWYTMIPASALAGYFTGVAWPACGVYVTSLSMEIAAMEKTREKTITLNHFNGILMTAVSSTNLVGNLISSLVLYRISASSHSLYENGHGLENGTFSLIANTSMYTGGYNFTSSDDIRNIAFSRNITQCGPLNCPFRDPVSTATSQPDQVLVWLLMGVYMVLHILAILIGIFCLRHTKLSKKKKVPTATLR